MRVFEVRWEIPVAAAELTADALIESEQSAWSVFEDIIVRRAWLTGLFASAAEATASAVAIRPLLPARPAGEPIVRELAETEWRDSYKQHFHAWQFGRLHWVPVWERGTYQVPAGEAVLWLDPGLAFGTGNHETTRLCVERLVAHAAARGTAGSVIDAGCGSGILALSAARLGFTDVFGFDNDPDAVRVSRENSALNELHAAVRWAVADVSSGLADVQAEVVLANILAHVLVAFAGALVAAVKPGGALVLSGILSSEIADVRRAFAPVAPGWSQDSRALGDWSDLLLRRPA